METNSMDIGMIGLGVMGKNLSLNMGDHHFSVVGYDKDPKKIQGFNEASSGRAIQAVPEIKEFITALKKPRAIVLLVPAGPPVDAVIRDLIPSLDPGDILIDGGNSYYKDTELRQKTLADRGLNLLGVGISGGEFGARHGPSMMPGGTEKAYERVRPIFEAVAASVNGEPCVTYLGPGAAGHYVKMVHNGLEYGWLQLIAETYDLFKRGMGFHDEQLQTLYAGWNKTELNSYLIEITAEIFAKVDPTTGKKIVDLILDEAEQKGTGKWTSQDAMDLQIPIPTIDIAVSMREISAHRNEREAASEKFSGPPVRIEGDPGRFVEKVRNALFAGMILTMTQGMNLLKAASDAYHYDLDLASVARIWRGGCIIRARLLETIYEAYQSQPGLNNLLMDAQVGKLVSDRIPDLRSLVNDAVKAGIPAPGMMASLGYFDSIRSAWLPANLIQAQRDYFGAHNYERVDEKGIFHTEWQKD